MATWRVRFVFGTDRPCEEIHRQREFASGIATARVMNVGRGASRLLLATSSTGDAARPLKKLPQQHPLGDVVNEMNTQLFKTAIVFAFLLIPSGLAKAQYRLHPAHPPYAMYRVYAWYPWYVSTPGGFMHGYADVLRSMGLYNLYSAQAARHEQEACRRWLDNRVKSVDTHFTRRAINRDGKALLKGPPLTKEQRAKVSSAQRPQRLTADELHPVTGRIQWPAALRVADFAATRASLQRLFAERAARGGFDGDGSSDARGLVDELRTQLREREKSMRGNQDDSIQALRFLKSLAFEVKFDPGTPCVASR
jgi:hypothetical protein